ncbi:MAG: hypothetical protein QOH26_74 [Actinomycetota bacterium]|jgi:ribosomal protein S18 acetylase RimI-like enzyme|nr:hypothetical protein [Actinomycetota bacterium]
MAAAGERDLVRHVSLLYSPPLGEVTTDHEWVTFTTGLPSRHHNGVLRSPLILDEATVERRLKEFERAGVPLMWWFFTERGGMDARTHDYLLANGLELESNRPGMGLPLDALAQRDLPPGSVMERVSDVSTFEIWRGIVNRAFGQSPAEDGSSEAFRRYGFDISAPFQHYVCRSGESFVAAVTLTPVGSFVGVSNVSTLPDARRRGFGSGLLAASLSDTASRGARVAVLSADDSGAAVYRGLGFKEVSRHLTYVKRQGRA